MQSFKLTVAKQKLEYKSGETFPNDIETIIEYSDNPWDAAHQYLKKMATADQKILYIEPEIEMELFEEEREANYIVRLNADDNGYLRSWPPPPQGDGSFVWHLGKDYSELEIARERVWNGNGNPPTIKIAHIDTGYELGHPALPSDLEVGISFVDGEEGQPAIDNLRHGAAEQQGHGTATMSLLAGKKVNEEITDHKYQGYFGAIPFAKIIPIRICDTVALMRSKSFVKAVEYAISQGCEVISMSMAGAPTKEWADVVNKAYLKGIVMVTAAGNSWNKSLLKILPKKVLYPARWERVIAATGITANHTPYAFDAPKFLLKIDGNSMQGNYGPPEVMKHALAAYTPNTTWATLPANQSGPYFSFDGGGTSSATPQIAAAAALWIIFKREELEKLVGTKPEDQWKRVEAVKFALFNGANRDYQEWQKYLGQGALRANVSLCKFPDNNQLNIAKEAMVTWDGIIDFLGLMLGIIDDNEHHVRTEMFALEVLQTMHKDANLHFLLGYDEKEIWSTEDKIKAKEELLKSPFISTALKAKIESINSNNS